MQKRRHLTLALIGILLMLAGLWLALYPVQGQGNTPIAVTVRVAPEIWPSVTAAVATQTARAFPPTGTATPAPSVQVLRRTTAEQINICLFCVIVDG